MDNEKLLTDTDEDCLVLKTKQPNEVPYVSVYKSMQCIDPIFPLNKVRIFVDPVYKLTQPHWGRGWQEGG